MERSLRGHWACSQGPPRAGEHGAAASDSSVTVSADDTLKQVPDMSVMASGNRAPF